MKKIYMLCGVLLLGMLAGCGNAQDSAQAVAMQSVNYTNQSKNEKATVTEEKGTTETCEESFQAGEVEVSIDATIYKQGEDLPVVNVTPHKFTSEDLKRWGNVLFKGKKLVEYFGAEECETQYQYHNVAFLRGETDSDALPKEGEDYNLKFKAGNYEEGEWVLRSIQRNTDGDMEHSITATFYGPDGAMTKYNPCSDEYAMNMAEQLMNDLGLTDEGWRLDEVTDEAGNLETCNHAFVYRKYYEGVPSFHDLSIRDGEHYQGIELAVEKLVIHIENGNVAEVRYYNPMDVTKVVETVASTLSTEEMMDSFKKEMQSQDLKQLYISSAYSSDSRTAEYDAAKMEVKITKIEEGLCCVKSEEGTYQMIPVWKFEGNYYVDGDVWAEGQTFMVVNAMDGGIVNKHPGIDAVD